MEWIENKGRTTRPFEDCEVFVIAEVLEDCEGFRKGDRILQTDWYNAEADMFHECDDEWFRVLMWQYIEFPEVPVGYEVDEIIHTFRVMSRTNQ